MFFDLNIICCMIKLFYQVLFYFYVMLYFDWFLSARRFYP